MFIPALPGAALFDRFTESSAVRVTWRLLLEAPERERFKSRFDCLADVIDRFTMIVGLNRYAIYVFDDGAPVGFRLAALHPDRITAIISQDGNA